MFRNSFILLMSVFALNAASYVSGQSDLKKDKEDPLLPLKSLSGIHPNNERHEGNSVSESSSFGSIMSGCREINIEKVNNDTNFAETDFNKENCNRNLPLTSVVEETKQMYQEIIDEAVTVSLPDDFEERVLAADTQIKFKNSQEQQRQVGNTQFGLQFLEIPKGDDMRIHDLRLEDEYLLFEAFSDLMGYLQPSGSLSDLLREIMNKRIPFHLVTFQILKMDTTMIIWIIVWAIVAICLPFGLSSCLCCPNRRQRLNEDFSIRSESSTGDKTERVFGVLLHILLILFLAPLILILAGNEQISKSITKLPWTSGIIFKDLNTFLHNTHMQISFSLSSSIDITIDTIKKDLEDIPAFVGEPYQKDLSGETGIDVALLALEDLKSGTAKATTVIAELLEACAAAKVASVLFQNQVDEIARQLTIAKQLCETRDRPVCYTLQSSGYDVAFSVDNITTDYNIRQLDRIRMETNFNNSIDEARKKFEGIPNQVQMDSTQFVRDMKIVLSKKRTEVYKSIHALDVLARSTAETLRIKEERTKEVIRNIVNWDMWRWMVVLGMASFLGIIWGLLLCGAPCGCITTSKTISFLMTGITLSCISCIFIWVMGTIALVVGSHGKGFVCSSLYDYPRFEILGLMMDPHGFLYKKGAFEEFGTPNDPLQISEVLKYSQHDQTAYFTFHLFHQINITSVANYREWRDLEILFHNFSITEKAREEFLEPSLQLNLQTLAIASSANLTSLQKQAALPITNRDLNSFADQLHTVARQLSDAATARKFDNIAFSVKNLIRNELQKLSNIKNSILLKITMLEVLLPPLGKQANQSLAHLKSIQYFLDNEGWKLAEKSRKRFVARLENCLEELHNYVTKKVTKEIGKCRPLWEIFHSVRFYLCKLIVDPTNGIAFSSFFLILVFVATTPVVMKLVEYYKEYNDEELTLTSPRYPYTGFGPDEEETWTSPRSETSRLNLAVTSSRDQERLERSSSSSSPSPQRQSSSHIPVPPRLPTVTERVSAPRRTDEPSMSKSPRAGLSTISAKFSKARAYTHKSLSKGRSPRRRDRHHESLRLVEPTWRVGSSTPRSWI